MGYRPETGRYHCERYRPAQELWERVDVDMGALGHGDCCFCAGDGCLFAVTPPVQDRGSFPLPGSRFHVFRFCPGTAGWEPIASSIPNYIGPLGFSWVYLSGHLYGTFMDGVQSVNVSTGQWETLAPRSGRRWTASTLCVVDGRLFLIGGDTASVEEYMAAERRWVSVPDMPREVWHAAAVAFEGKLLVIGGVGAASSSLSAVVEYDPRDGSWKELPSLISARHSSVVTVLEGDVVVMGGWQRTRPEGSRLAKSVERYNRWLQCWGAMPSLPGSLVVSRNTSAAVVVRDVSPP